LGELVISFSGAYSASKAAQLVYANALRRELSGFGISVSMVEPGFVETNMSKNGFLNEEKSYLNEEQMKYYGSYFSKEQTKMRRDRRLKTIEKTDTTDKALFHAVTSTQPRGRYLLNFHAPLYRLSWHMPDWLSDLINERLTWVYREEGNSNKNEL